MKIIRKSYITEGTHTAHILLLLLPLFILIFLLWNKPQQVISRGIFTYIFILTCVYLGRLYMHQLFAQRNLTLLVFYGFLIITALSLILGWSGMVFKAKRFQSEILIITFPLVGFLMGVGMLISRQRIIKRRSKLSSNISYNEGIKAPVDYIFIKSEGKQFKILYRDILYAEASRNYTKAVMENHIISSAISFSNFEKILRADQFIRVHRSFIINKSKISHIEGNRIFLINTKCLLVKVIKSRYFR